MTTISALFEMFCLKLYYVEVHAFSLWQAVFLVSCACAAWNAVRLLRSTRVRSLAGIGAVLVLGAGLRLGLSPRNIVDANCRGFARYALLSGFPKELSALMVRDSNAYYIGYGQTEYWKLFTRHRANTGIDDVFAIDGATAIVTILIFFVFARMVLGDSRRALYGAALLAFCPASIRLAFGDSVYGFGGALILLSLIHLMLFFEYGSAAALFPALGFGYCALYTHAAFLPFPLMVPFFYPLGGRRWREIGKLFSGVKLGLVVLFLTLSLPAYYVGGMVYSSLATVAGLSNPLGYLWTVVRFLLQRSNFFLNPDFNHPVVAVLGLLGLCSWLFRSRAVLAAAAAAVFVLALPLPPAVVWLGPGVNYFANTGVVKQEHLLFFHLLAASEGLFRGVDFLKRWAPPRGVAAAVFLLLALQPLAYHDFIVREFNYQRELSFVRRALLRHDLGEHLFTLASAAPSSVAVLAPGKYDVHTISRSLSSDGNKTPPVDHEPTWRLLDCLLAERMEPVFYLPLACYYRHPGDAYRGRDPVLRDDCARFVKSYDLDPIEEETFLSDPYNIEFDRTDADKITLGFYRISRKPGVKTAAASGDCVGAEDLCAEVAARRIETLLTAGRRKEALAVLRGILVRRGSSAFVLRRLSEFSQLTGDRGGLLRLLDELVRIHPAKAGLQLARAGLLMDLGRRREAIQALRRAETLDMSPEESRRAALS